MTNSSHAIKLQPSLKAEAEKLAAADGTTLDQFINVAIAEKIAAMKTLAYLRERASRGSAAEALAILVERAGDDLPAGPGDRVSGD